MYVKRPWEIYLDLLHLAGWSCHITKNNEYNKTDILIRAEASNGDMKLQGTGKTLQEAIVNLVKQLLN